MLQLNKLKQLKLGFSEQSKSARFSAQEAVWMEELCCRLKSFEILFGGSENFQASLRDRIQGSAFIRCERVQEYPGFATVLKNVE